MNTSKKSNSLGSHNPESMNRRVDKMSSGHTTKNGYNSLGRKVVQKGSTKKRRQLFKQNKEGKF